MLKKRRKSRSKKASLRLLRQKIKKGIYFATVIAGAIFCYQGFSSIEAAPLNGTDNSAEVSISVEAETPRMSFEDYCRLNPVSVCWDNSEPTDFLYQEAEDTAVLKNEEFNPELAEKTLQQNPLHLEQLKLLVDKGVSLDIPEQNEKLFSEIEADNQVALDHLYEEPLPDNVIDVEDDQPFEGTVHYSHKSIKEMKVVPQRKPPYFGPEPVIAVVIDDMGISQRRTADIAKLKAPLTTAFLTYGTNLQKQVDNSVKAGHEIMIHVPMEPQRKIDIAPDTLTTEMSSEELEKNFTIMLDKFHNIKGVNNHMGSKLTEDEPRMEVIMKLLKKRNLFFLDSKTSAHSRAEEAARRIKVDYAHRHVFLDNTNDKDYILKQLGQAERLAFKNGYAIAIGHPKSQTYEALKDWLGQLPEKKIKLVHLSEIIQKLN